jgi:hypothetical protein
MYLATKNVPYSLINVVQAGFVMICKFLVRKTYETSKGYHTMFLFDYLV